MNTFEQPLLAGVPVVFPGGALFQLLTCASPVDVTFIGDNNRVLSTYYGVLAGLKDRPPVPFRNVEITSATGQTIKVAIGDGDGEYLRTSGAVDATVITPTGLASSPDVTIGTASITLILAANANRKNVILQGADTNAATVRIGEAVNVGAARGGRLPPGGALVLDTTAAIYGYCATAAQVVSVLEVLA